jgi:hypothetical protein
MYCSQPFEEISLPLEPLAHKNNTGHLFENHHEYNLLPVGRFLPPPEQMKNPPKKEKKQPKKSSAAYRSLDLNY